MDRLAYADDVELMGDEWSPRDDHVEEFSDTSGRVGLHIKEPKTKVMYTGEGDVETDFIHFGDLLLEVVGSFNYLESTVTSAIIMAEEIKMRISQASKCTWALKQVIGSKILSWATKIHTYTVIIRPNVTYACDPWAVIRELERMLLVFKRKILRRILGPVRDDESGEWRIRSNVELRQLTGLPHITSHIRAQHLRWAGHVARMQDYNIVKMVARGNPNGQRPPGRPRIRWSDNIRADLVLLCVDNPDGWWDLAQDRQRWRSLVAAAKDHMCLQLQE